MLTTGYFIIQNPWVQTQLTRKIAENLSKQLNTTISVGHVDISLFNRVLLDDVLIKDQQNDTLMFAREMKARIKNLDFSGQKLDVKNLTFSDNKLHIRRDSAAFFNFSFLLEALATTPKDTSLNWIITCDEFEFDNFNIDYKDAYDTAKKQLFVNDLQLNIANLESRNDSIHFNIEHLSLNNGKNLELKNLHSSVYIHSNEINFNNLFLKSGRSEIANTQLQMKVYSQQDSVVQPFDMIADIGRADIDFAELGELLPTLRGMDQHVYLSGKVSGNLNDLKGKNIQITTGEQTSTLLDFYINDLRDSENMYLFFDLKKSETSFNDLSGIRLPNTSKFRYLRFPESFYEAGTLEFKGNFSGFLTDFVTFGTLKSNMGSLSTDILVVPDQEGSVYYRGNVSTSNFKLGQLFQQKLLGNLTFNGSVDGNYNKSNESVSGVFKGNVQQIDLNGYNYKKIDFDGVLKDRMFDGLLRVNDPNLKFSFLGQLDFNKEIPDFDFNLQLDKALPGKLNLSKTYPDSEVAFKMRANFTGDQIDNLDGSINVERGIYKNRNGEVSLDGLNLETHKTGEQYRLDFNSDFFEVNIDGLYHFRSLAHTFEKTVQHFIPAIHLNTKPATHENDFTFQMNAKNPNAVAQLFLPDLKFERPFQLKGKINSGKYDIELQGQIPGVRYKNILARNIYLGNYTTEDAFSSKLKFGEIATPSGLKLYNLALNSTVSNSTINNTLSWSNFDELTYSGTIKTQTTITRADSLSKPNFEIKGSPSRIYIADSIWHISPFTVTIDSSDIAIENCTMRNNAQQISIEGMASRNSNETMRLQIKDFNLKNIDTYLEIDTKTRGMLNGNIAIADLFRKPVVLSDINIAGLSYFNQHMGDFSLVNQWNSEKATIDSKLEVIREGKTKLKAFGNYEPETGNLDYDISVDSVSLVVMNAFMRKNFSDFTGYGSGKVHLGGSTKDISIEGALYGAGAGLTIDATQVPYTFNDSVYFKNDTMLFDHIVVYDPDNNTGIFDGTIVQKNFGNMVYDLEMSTNKVRALNTTSVDNDQFYGKAIASGNLTITGFSRSILLDGRVTSLPGTDIKISMEDESELEQYDFIKFVSSKKTITESEPEIFTKIDEKEEGDLDIKLTVQATPEARVQLIYNSQIGDVIKAQGEGILLFEMNSEGEIFLSGNYNPTKGDYLFTLQNVINKRFTIVPGGTMVWSGDPYNANIDLQAKYRVKAVLYDLVGNSTPDLSRNQRVQVECLIKLKDELSNPTIDFDIDFPNAETHKKEEWRQYFSTEDELNKQILSLIAMGKFYTPDYIRGNYEAQTANMLGTTVSEMLSNQFSNMLSKIDDSWDVGVNYRPGNEYTDDEVELALSTQILNDRVTLNGNIGNNVNQFNTSNSQIVGDFEINVKLVPSGKIQFKAYSRSNNNLIYETAPYTQGIGLSFKEEYNSVDELLEKLKKLFKKKKR